MHEHLSSSLTKLADNLSALVAVLTTNAQQSKSCGPLATLLDLQQMEKRIMASQAEIDSALTKIDGATTKLAQNVQMIADTDQQISDEIDKFLANAPAGTVLTDAQVAALQAVADKAQATSDASDAQVAVLKAIATKGAGNPVPVPVPPTPPLPPV